MINNKTITAIIESIALFATTNPEWQAAAELNRLYDSMLARGIADQFNKVKNLIYARLQNEYGINLKK